MDKTTVLLATVFMLLWTCTPGSAEIIYVNVNGPNDPGTGTLKDPFHRIQLGIDAAINGDTVRIQQGIYIGVGNYDLDPNGKSIIISSTEPNNPNIVACTIIDPNKAGRGFYIHNGEDANCVISGLTIRNGYTTELGAGILCYNSSPSILNCIIIENLAGLHSGAGVGCMYSNPLIMNCVINNNITYDSGGGVESWFSSPRITNCIISNNYAENYGGGVDCYQQGNSVLTNCTLVGNSTSTDGKGGAVCLWGSSIDVNNSILWANQAGSGAQLQLLYGNNSALVSYCNVEGGLSGVDITEGQMNWGSGNIDSDPCFALFDPNGDPNLWDFHLQSSYGRWNPAFYRVELNNDGIINLLDFAGIAEVWMESGISDKDLDKSGVVNQADVGIFARYYLDNSIEDGWLEDSSTSSCIDAGDPNSDFIGEPWPNGKRINMGAFGGTAQASKIGNVADFNIDGKVNFTDLAELGVQWRTSQKTIEDLNGDGVVNLGDLEIMATNWLWEKQ